MIQCEKIIRKQRKNESFRISGNTFHLEFWSKILTLFSNLQSQLSYDSILKDNQESIQLILFQIFFPFFLYYNILFIMFDEGVQQKQCEQQLVLNYQSKKLLHMIQLQVLDIQSTLHYIQKKHTMHQLKEALSQIYNIFNQTEPLFRVLRGLFLHHQIKKIMNCFGIIYVILMAHLDKRNRNAIEVIQIDTVKSGIKECTESPKTIFKGVESSDQKGKSRPLGGVHLYNEQHSRHIQNQQPLRKARVNIQKTVVRGEASKEEINRMVFEELHDNSHIDAQADQILDIFTFKFKYGKEKQIVTFHDELLSISNFFKQAQNEAFQFLNKTKDQTSIITYNDTFRDVMSQIKKEKEDKLRMFTDRIRNIFRSIKSKTERKVAQMENKLMSLEQQTKNIKQVNTHNRETQTTFNIDEEIRDLRRRLADSQQKYRIIMEYKQKVLEEHTIIGLELQSEIGLKNREIVYLKLNLQENAHMISNLNRRVKFLTDSNKKIKDIVRKNEQPSKVMDVVEKQDQAERFSKEEADDEMALDQIRKQRKMAKKILLEKRNSSTSGPEKAIFVKRFTQQMDSNKKTTNNLLSRNLSEIYEGEGSQRYEQDSCYGISNKNNILVQQQSRSYTRKETEKISIIPDSRGQDSSRSIKSRQSLTYKSKKVITQKHISQIVEPSNLKYFVKKMRERPQLMNEDSMLDECSDQQRDYIRDNQHVNMGMNSEQYGKIELMFQKQMKRTKNIINNNKNISFLSPSNVNDKTANKSFFSSHKYNTQESVPSSQSINTLSIQSKNSFRNSQHQEYIKSPQRFSKYKDSQYNKFSQIKINDIKSLLQSYGNQSPKVNKFRQLNFCLCQYSISICQQIQKTDSVMQTEANKVSQAEQDSTNPFQTRNNNTAHLNKFNEPVSEKDNKTNTDKVARSATQSKMTKNKHLKTLYRVSTKQNERYFFGKNAEKGVDEEQKNRQSCLQIQEDVQKYLEELDDKRDSAYQQSQKMKEERQMRKMAIKCRTLKQFKARVAEMHKLSCGQTCKHLEKFVQNYIKYKQDSKQKMRLPIKNLCENIVYAAGEQQLKNYFPVLEKKKS